MKYDVKEIQTSIKALPKEVSIYKLDKELDIVVHVPLDDESKQTGTVCDLKDLPRQTIYRIGRCGAKFMITVVKPSPFSVSRDERFETLEEGIDFALGLINQYR